MSWREHPCSSELGLNRSALNFWNWSRLSTHCTSACDPETHPHITWRALWKAHRVLRRFHSLVGSTATSHLANDDSEQGGHFPSAVSFSPLKEGVLDFLGGTKVVILKGWCLDQWHRHHLGTWQKWTLLGPAPHLLNWTLWSWGPGIWVWTISLGDYSAKILEQLD